MKREHNTSFHVSFRSFKESYMSGILSDPTQCQGANICKLWSPKREIWGTTLQFLVLRSPNFLAFLSLGSLKVLQIIASLYTK